MRIIIIIIMDFNKQAKSFFFQMEVRDIRSSQVLESKCVCVCVFYSVGCPRNFTAFGSGTSSSHVYPCDDK
jgi:hypothetical protein